MAMVSGKTDGLCELLRQELEHGTWGRGESLPAERDLAEQYRVSRITVRGALERLVTQGLIERSGRRRVVAAAPRPAQRETQLVRCLVASPADTGRYAFSALWSFGATNDFYGEITRGLMRGLARRRQVRLRYLQTPGEASPLASVEAHNLWAELDGMIVVNHRLSDSEVAAFRQRRVAVVSFGPPAGKRRVSYVDLQNSNGMYQATRHLLELGRRRIGVVGLEPDRWYNEARLGGYRQAYEERGIRPLPEWILPTLTAAGDAQADEIWAQLAPRRGEFDALIFSKGWAGYRLYSRLHAAGWDIPRRTAIVLYDDPPPELHYDGPAMTSVRQPFADLAESALQLLVEEVADPLIEPMAIIHQPMLVVRESCGVRLVPPR